MKTALWLAILFGSPLAAFVAASPFYRIDHSIWLRLNDSLVIATLGGVAILGYMLREDPWPPTAWAIVCYTAVIAGLFMASYLISTWFFRSGMKWMPLFHRDYVYHQHTSVEGYLFTGNNYVELVKLHLFCWMMMFSGVYFGLGALATTVSRCLGHSFRHG